VADGVYLSLAEALMVGRFEPGQALTIAGLADMFQTSHMPVREALRRLSAEGALEIGGNGSARVPAVSRAALDDVCRARIALETLATELAVEEIDHAEVEALERVQAAHRATAHLHDAEGMLALNRDFHFTLYRASRSEVLPRLIASLWLRYGPFMRMLSAELDADDVERNQEPFMAGHREIVEAVRARDGKRAAGAVRDDIAGTQGWLLRRLP
jgi:DNA-binding GntR family transcriptional regulator